MSKLKIHPSLYISKSKGKGLGVFSTEDLPARKVIEKSSVIVMSPEDRKHIEKTFLQNYIFEWADDNKSCCMALGYISLYNHSYAANCEYIMDFDKNTMVIKTLRTIKAGDELTINYNGEWDNKNEVWFEVKE